jgi:NAD(P)-dependent dehydrogenase (short-subunit alcohol dehydrogenase family)
VTEALVVGTVETVVADLAAVLGADVAAMPPVEAPADGLGWRWADELERWRADASDGPPVRRVVVAPWAPVSAPVALAGLDLAGWVDRAEVALARWVAAFGVARARCDDGGAVVAVVDRPAPLDCAGWAPETGVADAVEALTRSLARSEGPRGVRVNAVTTPARLTEPPVVDPAPSLATFPGSVLLEAAGAVRLLLEPDAIGLTGTVLHADCGRSWR